MNTITLRPHQLEAIADEQRIRREDPAVKNVLLVLPTGAGKSLTVADYALKNYVENKVCIVFAHRDVLISQLSEALCRTGVHHSFICSNKAKLEITNRNLIKYGNSFYDETSTVIISSNPTFSARLKKGSIPQSLLSRVNHWIQDEAHHTIRDSVIFGSCVAALPNAIGLGVTATPKRNDKKGLGRHADGYFDAMSVTTNMWKLIVAGMLSPYKVYVPPSGGADRKGIKTTASGEVDQKDAANRVNKIEVTGNAVNHYLAVSRGKPAITFCQNIDHARAVAIEFNNAGISSKVVSSKDSLAHREQAMREFENGSLLNLVNVDLLGEGYDCPAVTTVIMLRITKSYSLFKQQFGRMLRNAEGKTHGILLDHVGNVNYMRIEHGLDYIHDDPEWTLDRDSKRKKNDDGVKLETWVRCKRLLPQPCGAEFKESEKQCPECGWSETDADRVQRITELQNSDEELVELGMDIVDALIKERARIDQPVEQFARSVANLPTPARMGALNRHAHRLHAQVLLRDVIQKWCAKTAVEKNYPKKLVQREFQRVFGTDILNAQLLGEREANELNEKIKLVI